MLFGQNGAGCSRGMKKVVPFSLLISVVICLLIVSACGKKDTPNEVLSSYHALLAKIKNLDPEKAIPLLETFAEQNKRYLIADAARLKVAELRRQLENRKWAREQYDRMQTLINEGKLDEAETILLGVGRDLPMSAAEGRSLEIKIKFLRVGRLMKDKKYAEALALLLRIPVGELEQAQIKERNQVILDIASTFRNQAHYRVEHQKQVKKFLADGGFVEWSRWTGEVAFECQGSRLVLGTAQNVQTAMNMCAPFMVHCVGAE